MADNALSRTALPGLVGAVFFVSLNLHHNAMDAVMWRSRVGMYAAWLTRPYAVR